MMIGDQAVGKTALLVRYTEDDFSGSVLPTIGIDFKVKVGKPCPSAGCSLLVTERAASLLPRLLSFLPHCSRPPPLSALISLLHPQLACLTPMPYLPAQNIEIDGKKVKLQIWDTAGQVRGKWADAENVSTTAAV
jgi:GTPase SAR1 family protein